MLNTVNRDISWHFSETWFFLHRTFFESELYHFFHILQYILCIIQRPDDFSKAQPFWIDLGYEPTYVYKLVCNSIHMYINVLNCLDYEAELGCSHLFQSEPHCSPLSMTGERAWFQHESSWCLHSRSLIKQKWLVLCKVLFTVVRLPLIVSHLSETIISYISVNTRRRHKTT